MIGTRRLGTWGFEVTEKTIEDFGAQWTRNTDNEGYYGSVQLLYDIVGGLVLPEELRGARVADIGSGTGRIVNMLLDGEVQSVIAVEPSAAFDVLKVNTAERASSIEYVRGPGEALPADRELDFVFSLGVIHHIPKPDPVLRAAYASLRPGGSVVLWLYGYEGNEVYLAVARPLRLLTTHLPDAVVDVLSAGLDYALDPYIALARRLPLPMRDYFVGHYGKLDRKKRRLTVFDQLNPAYAKYYRREEVVSLLERSGFVDIEVEARHGYSWTARGRRP